MIRRVLLAALAIIFMLLPAGVAAQTENSSHSTLEPEGPSGGCVAGATADSQEAHGFDLANLDRSVKPCDDFFQFANGGWIKAHPIPAAYPRWGTFDELRDHNEDVLHQILESAAKNRTAAAGSNLQKIGDFYGSCMDETAIEAAGVKPLDAEFQRIAALKNSTDLQAELARLHKTGVPALFHFESTQDFKDSAHVIAEA